MTLLGWIFLILAVAFTVLTWLAQTPFLVMACFVASLTAGTMAVVDFFEQRDRRSESQP